MPPSPEQIAAFLAAEDSVGKPLYLTVNNVKCFYKKHTQSSSGVYHVYFKGHPTLGSDTKAHTEFNWDKTLDPFFKGPEASSVVDHKLVRKWGCTSMWCTYVHAFLSPGTENQNIELHQPPPDSTANESYAQTDFATLVYETSLGKTLTVSWGQRSVFLRTQLSSDVGCTNFINIRDVKVVTVYK